MSGAEDKYERQETEKGKFVCAWSKKRLTFELGFDPFASGSLSTKSQDQESRDGICRPGRRKG